MRDYAELILDLWRHHCDAKEDDTQEVCEECAYDVIVADKSKFNGITDVCTCGLMHRAADALEELLDELTTIRKQLPHWISVEERLPKKDETVIVYYSWTGQSGTEYKEVSLATLEEMRYCGNKLLGWMPLPAPPNGVE